MSSEKLIQDNKFVTLVAPVADAGAGTVTSNSVNMQDYTHLTAVLSRGAAASGTSVITVQSSADSAASSPTAIPFRVKKATASTLDSYDDEANVAAAGYTYTAELDNLIDIIEVNASDMDGDDSYVSIKLVESVNQPTTFGIVGILSGARQKGDDKRSVRA
jgi:hypothetical protein